MRPFTLPPILLIVAVCAGLWLFRYEYHEGPLGLPLRTNRFTGQVEKFWSEPDNGVPLGWYPIPMGEADRRLQEAERQEKLARQQAERAAEWDRAYREGRVRAIGDGIPVLPPPTPAPWSGQPPTAMPQLPPVRYVPLPPATTRGYWRVQPPHGRPDMSGLYPRQY